jgi:acetolactate synthase I/II/III large subunit
MRKTILNNIMIKLSDYVINYLAQKGIKHIFMVVGGGAMHLDDSLAKCEAITHVCNLHEHAASIAAQAYAQAGGKIGVTIVTTGPGGTNSVTGVAAAWVDSVPMLVISGQVKRAAMIGNTGMRCRGSQEIDIISIVKPITKYALTILEPEKIKYHLEKALYEATHQRPGPVWLDIPLDVQAAMIDETTLEGYQPEAEIHAEMDISKLVWYLKRASNPVILAGHGIELAGAKKQFIRFAEHLNIPILTTWKSIGLIPEENHLFCGRPGGIAQRGANIVQERADVLLAIGCRLDNDQVGFNYDSFAPLAEKFIVDIDPHELLKFSSMERTHVIQGDAAEILDVLLQQDIPPLTTEWVTKARAIYERFPVMQDEYRKHDDGVNIYHLIDVLSQYSDQSDVIAPGNSAGAPNCTFQAWKVKRYQKFVCAAGYGSMGFGIPSALASALANPDSRVICVNGDGGWQLNTQELSTISSLNLNIKFFILNNGGYASIRNMQDNYFNSRYIGSNSESGLSLPDTLKVASAYGIKNLYNIAVPKDVDDVVRLVLQSDGPTVCEVLITKEQKYAPRLMSRIVNGIITTPHMEDLWPELSRDELNKLLSDNY